MIFQIAGKRYEIDKDHIVGSTENLRPNTPDGRYKHFVELHGRRFPIKQPISAVTSLPHLAFTAGHAHRILVKLGFEVYQIPESETAPTSEARNPGATAKFAVLLDKDEDGYVVASCPALPGCHSQGRTRQEAISNIREAIRGYVASMRKHGEPVPTTEVEEIEVAV